MSTAIATLIFLVLVQIIAIAVGYGKLTQQIANFNQGLAEVKIEQKEQWSKINATAEGLAAIKPRSHGAHAGG